MRDWCHAWVLDRDGYRVLVRAEERGWLWQYQLRGGGMLTADYSPYATAEAAARAAIASLEEHISELSAYARPKCRRHGCQTTVRRHGDLCATCYRST